MARENAEFDHASLTSDFVEEFVDFDLDSIEHQDDPPEETFNEEPETPPQPGEEPDTATAPDSPGRPPSETEPQTAPARKTDPAGPPLVAVCGTEGGAGTTTVTALMAFIASRQNLGPVLLTDLGGPSSSLAAMLNKRARYSLASAANAHRAGLFATNGKAPFALVNEQLRLMAKEPDALDQVSVDPDPALRDLLIDSQEDHFATFIDCGRLEQAAEQQVASLATHIVWVCGGTLTSARKARAKITSLGFTGSAMSILYVRGETDSVPARSAQEELGKAADESGLAIVVSPPVGDFVSQGLVPTASRAMKPLSAALERILG